MVGLWRISSSIAATLLMASQALAQPALNAHPTGGVVTAGAAAIAQNATTTTIDQSSPRAAINWQSFDIGSQQSVRFNQPSIGSVALNRVLGPDPSQIAGRIGANGQIIIVNQSGVTFYRGAQVNTSGLMVTAAGIHDADFMAGSMNFNQPAAPNARVVNDGKITIANAGLAALVAPSVANSGTISATLGHVVLAGAQTATLDLYGDGLLSLDITNQVTQAPSGVTALVSNTGVIQANGGSVQLTARAADGVVRNLVQAGGTVQADNGTVVLNGIGGSIVVEGQLSASGGNIEIAPTGNVTIAGTARIDASGGAGGGTVAIGTTLSRAKGGPSVTPRLVSANVAVEPGATISADATAKGNGGKVTVLSTGTTNMAGSLSAKGGPAGGNGGLVEVSGGTLVLTGHVDATAPLGTTGTLLLDPLDLYISDTRPGAAAYAVVARDLPTIAANQAPDGATVSWVSPSLLATQNANISLAATNDLFVATSFGTANTLNLNGFSLTLTARRNLTIDRGFTVNAFSMSFTATTGTISLSGSSGVAAGLITSGQLAALAPTSLQGLGLFITMNAGSGISLADATLGATMARAGFLNLTTSAGGVTQSPTGTIIAGEVTSAGGVVGTMSLPSSTNAIGQVDYIAVSGGDLTVVDGRDLVIGGTLRANNLFFEIARPGGVLTLGFPGDGFDVPATVTAGAAGRISLVADAYVNNIAGSTLTTTGGSVELAPFSNINISLFGASGLVLSPAFLAIVQTNGGTLDLGGFTNVPLGATTPSASAASVTIDNTANLTGIATTLRMDANGAIGQPGGPIAASNIVANGGSVTLTNPGNTVDNASGSASGAFSLIDASPLALGNIAAGSVETIEAPSLAIPGTQQAPLLSLTATKGGIAETGSLVVGTLTGSSVGPTSLTGTNQVSALGDFTAPSFTLNDGTNLTIAGTLTAPTILIQAPASQIVFGDGATIVTGGTARPAGAIQPGLEPANGAPGAYIVAASFVQAGSSTVLGSGGGPATLQIATSGNMQFDPPLGLNATGTWLILGLPNGTANGNVYVNALDVLYTTPGNTNLFGTIDGITGGIAAASGFIQPAIDTAYRFNNCVIEAKVCSPPTVPLNTPLGGLRPFLPGSPLPSTVLLNTTLGGLQPFLPGSPQPFVPLPNLATIEFLMLPEQPGDWVDPDVVPPNISYVDY
jgi:filamentous hemagglutinin family protein